MSSTGLGSIRLASPAFGGVNPFRQPIARQAEPLDILKTQAQPGIPANQGGKGMQLAQYGGFGQGGSRLDVTV